MTILKVRHVTTYRYAKPVRFGEHRLMFRPRDSHDQRLLNAELTVSPQTSDTYWIHDVFGNSITICNFDQPDDELRFETNIVLDHTPLMVPRFQAEKRCLVWPFEYDPDQLPDLAAYMRPHHPGPEVEAFARRFTNSGLETETGHLLLTMTMGIREILKYSRRTDPGTQTPQHTLATGQGTCRDFALLMIEACRTLGFAARFVTGYIYVPSRDTGQLRGGGATHAWVQVFVPGAGWVEFDPTNGIVGSKDLVRIGVAREPRQAKPLSGKYSGDPADYQGMTVEVNVTTDPGFNSARQRAAEAAQRLSQPAPIGPSRPRTPYWRPGGHART
ncbi:transglutaminase family protein [Devosia sp.]|uniref:transglutaminase family protein n=1 Tax=Devosia sp. TaxID=1871048 RepID=UPI003A8DC848